MQICLFPQNIIRCSQCWEIQLIQHFVKCRHAETNAAMVPAGRVVCEAYESKYN